MNALVTYVRYLEKAFVPINLSGFYPHPRAHLSLAVAGLSFAILAAVTVLAVINWRRRQYLFVGWFWYLGTLVPMIGLVQVGGQQMADRYTYLPLLGIYVAITWLVPTVVPARLAGWHVVPALATATVAVYAAIAWVQVGYWRNSISLYRHMLAVTDDNFMAHYLLGNELSKQHQLDEALTHLREAVRIEPRSGRAHYYLGVALQTQQRLNEAAAEYQASLALNERFYLRTSTWARSFCRGGSTPRESENSSGPPNSSRTTGGRSPTWRPWPGKPGTIRRQSLPHAVR